MLKIKADGIILGDYVEIDEKSGVITEVFERKSRFIRPNIANVDCINVVISYSPKPDFIAVDKLIVACVKAGAKFIITLNKGEIDSKLFDKIQEEYSGIADGVFLTSCKTGEGIDKLKEYLKGKLVAFAGQSAVGKTSLINAISGLNLKTGDLSKKTERGKQTTTVSQIISCADFEIADTPGFSIIKNEIKPEELTLFYPEFVDPSKQCYYRGCVHINEPDCCVKEYISEGKIPKGRYDRYIEIYKELKEAKRV